MSDHCGREMEVVYTNYVGPQSRHEVQWCRRCGFLRVVYVEFTWCSCGVREENTMRADFPERFHEDMESGSGDAPHPQTGGPAKEESTTVAPPKARSVDS
jgi:hypothetical protein